MLLEKAFLLEILPFHRFGILFFWYKIHTIVIACGKPNIVFSSNPN
ncbi:hypothetical protein LEP1GSC158_1712 [Leptospira interrogans serovar Zanoni str. LT2156]|uniref:Uncharacterized protein n=1 Tax=Leptospira interrogans serovar Zanoni str. LT2156 TaxID=1001601 RepID=M6HHR8_LEPIR|nr:hypothetical protein LEP1GSC158_1712 [Leptospira interrogans serovar Zanoni str. LT2156]